MMVIMAKPHAVNVAEAKRDFSRLLGRVAFAGETVVILRRGRPMAKLVPVESGEGSHLADMSGWLDDDDPFFAAVDDVVAGRKAHRPRVVGEKAKRTTRR